MTVLFDELCEGYIAAKSVLHGGNNRRIGEIQSRLMFWSNEFGSTPVDEITEDMVDDALFKLKERPKFQPLRKKAAVATSKTLSSGHYCKVLLRACWAV